MMALEWHLTLVMPSEPNSRGLLRPLTRTRGVHEGIWSRTGSKLPHSLDVSRAALVESEQVIHWLQQHVVERLVVRLQQRVRSKLPQRLRRCRGLLLVWLLVGCTGPPPPTSDQPLPSGGPSATVDPDSPFQTTLEQFMLLTKACVEDKGYSVEVDPEDWSLLFSFGSEREQQGAIEAVHECQAQIDPARLNPLPPPSPEQLRAWYAYVVAQAQCLVAAGYPVPSPPPEQVFLDTEGEWDPYFELEQAGSPASREDKRACDDVPGRPAFLDW